MSKPRSRLIGRSDSDFRTVHGFTTAIHFGKQAKHMPGQPGYDPTKSTVILGIKEIQRIVEHLGGTGQWVSQHKEVVDAGKVVGTYRNPHMGISVPTTRMTIHYSKTGAHIVPAEPAKRK